VVLADAGACARWHPCLHRVALNRHDRRVAAQAAGERLHFGCQIEPSEDFRELRIGIDLSHPVCASHGVAFQERHVTCEHDALAALLSQPGIVFDDNRVEAGEAQTRGERLQMHVEGKPRRPRAIDADALRRIDDDGLKRRVDGDAIAVLHARVERARRTVDGNEIDFGVRNAEGLDRVLHRRRPGETMRKSHRSSPCGEEVVQAAVKPKGDFHVEKSQLPNETPRRN